MNARSAVAVATLCVGGVTDPNSTPGSRVVRCKNAKPLTSGKDWWMSRSGSFHTSNVKRGVQGTRRWFYLIYLYFFSGWAVVYLLHPNFLTDFFILISCLWSPSPRFRSGESGSTTT
ncbi:hypothetical protein C8J55DRAFT_463282 [Lentinula edodes]|uniref:Uncharacterized protein n=1 Tax=Lentinula lateritia TaxID=40482 RepID=A0A9W8ZR24_9AGAR|nr:hypothetical protein C8J55DRAFT_463282 [Lentinula edodes]